MNNKHPERDIDSIFKNAIDPVETEPSDKFWNRTYEEIIKRENKVYNKQMLLWKIISSILGTAIVLLAFYSFYIHDRVNNVENQLTQVEKKQTGGAGNKNMVNVTTTTPGNKIAAVLTNTPTVSHENGGATTHYPVAGASVNKPTTINKNITAAQNEPAALTRVSATNSNPGSNYVGADKNPLNNSSYGFGDKSLPGNYYSPSNTNAVTSKDNNNSSLPAATTSALSSAAQNEKPAVTGQKDSTPTLADNKNGADTLKPQAQMTMPTASKNFMSHLYIAAFFSPELTDNIINDNKPSGNVIVNNIKASEQGGITFSTGLKAGYDLSKHWSILTGLNYHTSSFSILPTEVHEQWQSNLNSNGYSIVTSDGTVEMPTSVLQYANDSLKAYGNSSVAYLGIPLQARYDVLPGSNLDYYIEAGFAANILLQTQTEINWETPSYANHCNIPSCEGLESYFVYNMGIGITYKLKKGITIFVEPGMQGPLTPISKNEPVTTYPYVFDLTLGLIYHF